MNDKEHPPRDNSSPERKSDGFAVATADWADEERLAALSRLLHRIRGAFGMDVVFVSQFAEGRRYFRFVEADPGAKDIVQVGASDPLEESYCQRVVDGRLPEAIPDAQDNPAAAALPVTKAIGLGAHLSVPIHLSDGELFGTLCCFSRTAQPSLGSKEAVALRELARFVATAIEAGQKKRALRPPR